jgi:hypothetical protein
VTETYWCPGAWPWEWFRTCTREVPDPEDPCGAPSCVSAKERAADARRRFDGACTGLRGVNAVLRLLRAVLSTPIWVLVVLAVIAALVGGLLAVLIWGLIAIWGISWFLVVALGPVAQSFAAELARASADLQVAIADVVARCPEHCRGDVSTPTCAVEP